MGAVSLEGLLRIKQDIICNLLVLCEAQSRSSKVVVIITRCITVTFRIIRRFFFFFFTSFHLIFTTTLYGKYYYSHFPDERLRFRDPGARQESREWFQILIPSTVVVLDPVLHATSPGQ